MDKLNRVTAVVDAISAQTQVAYDPNGRVLSLINALTHATGHTYDANDRIATRTDPVVNYQYDTLDRLTQVNAVSGCRASPTLYSEPRTWIPCACVLVLSHQANSASCA